MERNQPPVENFLPLGGRNLFSLLSVCRLSRGSVVGPRLYHCQRLGDNGLER
jgi:hypothetical protein